MHGRGVATAHVRSRISTRYRRMHSFARHCSLQNHCRIVYRSRGTRCLACRSSKHFTFWAVYRFCIPILLPPVPIVPCIPLHALASSCIVSREACDSQRQHFGHSQRRSIISPLSADAFCWQICESSIQVSLDNSHHTETCNAILALRWKSISVLSRPEYKRRFGKRLGSQRVLAPCR